MSNDKFDEYDDLEGFGEEFDSDLDFGDTLDTSRMDNADADAGFNEGNQGFGALKVEDPSESSKDAKKIAIMAVVLGIVLVLVIFFVFRIYTGSQNKNDTPPITDDAYKTTVGELGGNENSVDNVGVNDGSIDNSQVAPNDGYNVTDSTTQSNLNTPNNSDEQLNNENNSTDNQVPVETWTEFNVSSELVFSNQVDGEFTVTNIQHLARVANDQKDVMVKSVVKGNIAGLVGTYEIEIPYYKATKLSEGILLKVRYSYAMQDDKKIIGEIMFM